MSTFGVGQLARRAGVAIDTVRYYERNQLLVPAGRLESGYPPSDKREDPR